eukprot:354421-Ditylum_brightwellii.AAC.1
MSLLKQEVEQVTGPFKFFNTYSSGSKAVQWVLSNIGELEINKVLIGSGCYVSGNSSLTFTKLTTSMMNKDNAGEIQTANAHPMAKKHTIPLPYHIPLLFNLNWIVLKKFTCAVYKLN